MRKSLWILALLAVCAVAVMTAVTASVQGSREQIEVTQTTIAGDPSAAEDLHVRTLLNLKSQLFWQTDYAAGAEPRANTTFRFYQTRQHYPYEWSFGDLIIGLSSENFGINGNVNLEEHGELLMKPVRDVASRTPDGDSRTEVVQLCQYYDVYPVDVGSSGPMTDVERMENDRSFLTAYFSIPVPETDYMEVTVEKNTGGEIVDVHCSDWISGEEPDAASEDLPYLYADSVIAENEGWFVLCGNVDLSQSRGGYGLYRFPVGWYDQWDDVRFSEPSPILELKKMEKVYPLDPAFCEEISLEPGLDETELLLFTMAENGAMLTVLDSADCVVRQQVELGRMTIPTVWQHENLLILYHQDYETDSQFLQVLQRQDGQYAFWLQTEEFPLLRYGGRSDPVFCFDGNRLGVANYLEFYQGAAHRLMVYDQTGLRYAGDYFYNTDAFPERPGVLNWEDTLQISWTPNQE